MLSHHLSKAGGASHAGNHLHDHMGVHHQAVPTDEADLEVDSDVIWSWYTSTRITDESFPCRLAGRIVWALVVHGIGLAMLWSVFLNSSATALPGARNIGNTVFDVYFERCTDIGDTAALLDMVNNDERMFFEMSDRLWIGKNMKEKIFRTYNSGQSDENKLVEELCTEEDCVPTAITGINGINNATKMQLIFKSFIRAFCIEQDNISTSTVGRRLLSADEDPYNTAFGGDVNLPPGTPGWAALSTEQQRLWKFLGWDETSYNRWDATVCAANGCLPQAPGAPGFKNWGVLTEPELYAATALGFTPPVWNNGEDVRQFLRLTCDNYMQRNGLFAYVQIAAFGIMILVAISEVRNFVLACMLAYAFEASNFKRALLFLISFLGYLFVPVIVICASGLVIFESTDELGVLMDSLALLFILEVNNYFQFMHNPSSDRWKLQLPAATYAILENTRDWFGRIASITLLITVVIPLGSLFTGWPHVYVHPDWLFNPHQAPDASAAWIIGACLFFFIIVAIVIALFTRQQLRDSLAAEPLAPAQPGPGPGDGYSGKGGQFATMEFPLDVYPAGATLGPSAGAYSIPTTTAAPVHYDAAEPSAGARGASLPVMSSAGPAYYEAAEGPGTVHWHHVGTEVMAPGPQGPGQFKFASPVSRPGWPPAMPPPATPPGHFGVGAA